MNVILLTNVKNVGKKNEIVSVKDGYGSFLIKSNQAVLVSDKSLKVLQKQQADQKVIDDKIHQENLKLKEQLEKIVLNFTLNSNNGQAFGCVSVKMICDELLKKHNIKLDKHNFDQNSSWQLGAYEINVKLSKTVIAKLVIKVSPIQKNK